MNFLILLFFVIYSVVATPISITNNNHKIIGGFDAYAGQFPYQALIRVTFTLDGLCGGSIISNQWILTSAGCAMVVNPKNMRVVVGSIYLNSGGTTHSILISVKHPDFNENSIANDIGLIRVNGQISYNDFVRPIPLTSDSISVGLPLTITGWGASSISEEVLPNTLQYVTLKSIPLDECKKRFPFPIPLFDTQLCTDSSNRQGLCVYDNGSPLVYNGQLHAVVSAPLYCLHTIPDIHTRVLPYRSWIKDITNV